MPTPTLKIGDIVLGNRRGTKRRIMGIELQPDGKVYYNYYKGKLVGADIPDEPIEKRTMGRCNETTMLNWGIKI